MKRKITNYLIFLLVLAISLTLFPMQSVFADEGINEVENSAGFYANEESSAETESPVMYASIASSGGQWVREANGRMWYRHADGSYTKSNFEYINGKWYFFNEYGWMQTGWLTYNGNKYYFNDDGSMRIGWLNYNNHYYYFNTNGTMRIGWLELSDLGWFYFNSDGTRHEGWLELDNLGWFYFNERGIRQTGWVHVGEYWYYMNSKGIMQTGWQKINNRWYYFNTNGKMNTKDLKEDVRKYTFYSSGELMSTEIHLKRQRQQKSNWCWAACSAMIGTYNTNSKITQEDIVKNRYGGYDANLGGSASDIVDGIRLASNGNKNPKIILSNDITFPGMIYYIDKNHPFVINIYWYDNDQKKLTNDGHSVIGAGYNMHEGKVYIIDPYKTMLNQYYYFNELTNKVRVKPIFEKEKYGRMKEIIIYP